MQGSNGGPRVGPTLGWVTRVRGNTDKERGLPFDPCMIQNVEDLYRAAEKGIRRRVWVWRIKSKLRGVDWWGVGAWVLMVVPVAALTWMTLLALEGRR